MRNKETEYKIVINTTEAENQMEALGKKILETSSAVSTLENGFGTLAGFLKGTKFESYINPMIGSLTAVASLVYLVYENYKHLDNVLKNVQTTSIEATKSMNVIADSNQEWMSKRANAINDIQKQQDLAKQIVTLSRQASVGNLGAESYRALGNQIHLLNRDVEGLNLAFDKQSSTLNMTAKELAAYIELAGNTRLTNMFDLDAEVALQKGLLETIKAKTEELDNRRKEYERAVEDEARPGIKGKENELVQLTEEMKEKYRKPETEAQLAAEEAAIKHLNEQYEDNTRILQILSKAHDRNIELLQKHTNLSQEEIERTMQLNSLKAEQYLKLDPQTIARATEANMSILEYTQRQSDFITSALNGFEKLNVFSMDNLPNSMPDAMSSLEGMLNIFKENIPVIQEWEGSLQTLRENGLSPLADELEAFGVELAGSHATAITDSITKLKEETGMQIPEIIDSFKDLGNLSEINQELYDNLSETDKIVLDMLMTMSENGMSALDDYGISMQDKFQEKNGIISDNAKDSIISAFEEMNAAIEENAPEALETAVTQMSDVLNGLLEDEETSFTHHGQKLIEQILEGLQTALEEGGELNTEMLSSIMEPLATLLADEDGQISQAGYDMMEKLLAGLYESTGAGKEEAANMASELVSGIADSFRSGAPEVQSAGVEMTDGMFSGIIAEFIKMHVPLAAEAAALIEKINAAIKSGEVTIPQGMMAAMAGLARIIVSEGQSAQAEAQTTGDGISQGVDSGIQAGIPKVKSSAQQVVASAHSSMAGEASSGKFNSIGVNIVDGVIAGMNSRAGALYSTASSIMSRLLSIMQSIPAIQSPSKVTTEYGEYIAEGLEMGLLNKSDDVVAAGGKVVSDTLDAMKSMDSSGIFTETKDASSFGGMIKTTVI